MSNDRSERLRQRRKESKQKAEEPGTAESSELSEPSEPSKPSESAEDSTPVKEEFVGTYMYLPESLKQELGPTFKILSAEYEREFGTELEKNRHFYPLVVKYGLDSLDSFDASDVRERLEESDLLDTTESPD